MGANYIKRTNWLFEKIILILVFGELGLQLRKKSHFGDFSPSFGDPSLYK